MTTIATICVLIFLVLVTGTFHILWILPLTMIIVYAYDKFLHIVCKCFWESRKEKRRQRYECHNDIITECNN